MPGSDASIGGFGSAVKQAALLIAVGVVLAVPAVAHGATYTAIDAGRYHTCAVTTGATPACWGAREVDDPGRHRQGDADHRRLPA